MNATLAIATFGEYHVILWLHTAADPSPEEWSVAMLKIVEFVNERKGDLSAVRALAISDGGAPNTVQRAEYTKLVGVVKAAAVTTVLMNPIKRGILTAVTWLNPNFRAYPPDRFEQALDHIGILPHKTALLAQAEVASRVLNPPLQTLKLMLEV